MNIGFGITGSFCTFNRILDVIKDIVEAGHNVLPIVTNSVLCTDTRFSTASEFMIKLKKLTGNEIVTDIVKAEPIGPQNIIDVLVVAPCTGNTLSKLANAITDNAVTMCAKAHLRNNKPVVIGISTNDALGFNALNLAKLLNFKNIYFVPFGQDAPHKKPKSLIADWDQTLNTIELAMHGEQIEPILTK